MATNVSATAGAPAAAPAATAAAGSSTASDGSKEFVVRVPKGSRKKYSVLKFNPAHKVDFTKCGTARMERENNLKQYKVYILFMCRKNISQFSKRMIGK